jgi:SAM-dependent methyltransferase
MAEFAPPSPWILRFAPLAPAGSPVLDLACGSGRHSRLFLARGRPVTALDRDVSGLQDIAGRRGLEIAQADLEDGSPWPLADRRFGAVVVVNYLWRPLLPRILEAVDDNGVLLYETFALGNETFGRPTNPDFLLRPGELLEMVRGRLQIVAYEHGYLKQPPAIKQRICAVRTDRPVSLYHHAPAAAICAVVSRSSSFTSPLASCSMKDESRS